MSIFTKVALVGIAAGTVGVLNFSQAQYSSPALRVEFPALAGLTGVVGTGASAASVAGRPVDRTFNNAHRVHIDRMVGQVELVTTPAAPAVASVNGQQSASPANTVRIQATGTAEVLKVLQIRAVGDELVLRLDKYEEEAWFPWNLFNMWSYDRKVQDLKVRITAAAGTPYDIEGLTGTIAAGDLDAPVSLDGHAVTARFGRVTSAKVSLAGSGRIVFGAVRESIDLDLAGAGYVEAASATAAQLDIAGSGDVVLGKLSGGLSADLAGAGDVRVASVNGPVSVDIAGSGNIRIEAGEATQFDVDIAGSGDVYFGGHAENPDVSIFGSGDVTIGSYSGNLERNTQGSGNFTVLNKPPSPPAP